MTTGPALAASDTDAILEFWFGQESDDRQLAASRAELWWSGSSAADAQIRPFAALRTQLIAHSDGPGLETARQRLAGILLIDQFSRALHRGTPGAFEHDPLALSWCLDGLGAGLDQALRPLHRVFFYLPLEHSESLAMQDRCVALFGALHAQAPAEYRDLYANYLDFAERHRAVIARFGRFPHRNRILGRPSTDEEAEFLKQPGSSF